MLEATAANFEEAHVEPLLALMQRAFSIVPEHARPKDSAPYLSHIHGDANPAGRAVLGIVQDEGRWVGSVSGVPMRFRRQDGKIVTGYQIGFFVVDSTVQRQGLGKKLVGCLTEHLRGSADNFIYTYPNARSIAVFDRLDYERLKTVPTRIHMPTLAMIANAGSKRLSVGPGIVAELEMCPEGEVPASLPSSLPLGDGSMQTGFVRDAAYFKWRFFGPDWQKRYRFARLLLQGEEYILALGQHSFKGIRFAVLVDVLPNLTPERYSLIARAAQAAGWSTGACFVYLNTSIDANLGSQLAAWSVDVPERFNPRPVKLLMHPDTTAVGAEELRNSLVMTADWMGF